MRKIKWGILSTSWFAREKVIPALKTCRHVERGHAGDDWTVIASGALRK